MQYKSNLQINLPVKIESEGNINFFVEVDVFEKEIRKAVDNKILKRNSKLVIFVSDSLGDDYIYKTKYRINNFL